MQKATVAEVAKALREAEIPPQFEPDEARLVIRVSRLVAAGQPVSPEQIEQIASTLSMPLDAATSFISKVSERDARGHVVGLAGLSQNDHPHRFEVDGRMLATWCAWDSLFLPPLLKQTAKVESSCPATRQKIRLTVTPEKVEQCEPPTALVSIVVPKVAKKGRESVEEIWMIFCQFVHFFSSPEAAAEWFSGKGQDPVLLTVDEGYELGRIAFADLLKYA